jgi:hypothetical protein
VCGKEKRKEETGEEDETNAMEKEKKRNYL